MDTVKTVCSEIIASQRDALLREYPALARTFPRLTSPHAWAQTGFRPLTPDESEAWPAARRAYVVESDQMGHNIEVDLYTDGRVVCGSSITVDGV